MNYQTRLDALLHKGRKGIARGVSSTFESEEDLDVIFEEIEALAKEKFENREGLLLPVLIQNIWEVGEEGGEFGFDVF